MRKGDRHPFLSPSPRHASGKDACPLFFSTVMNLSEPFINLVTNPGQFLSDVLHEAADPIPRPVRIGIAMGSNPSATYAVVSARAVAIAESAKRDPWHAVGYGGVMAASLLSPASEEVEVAEFAEPSTLFHYTNEEGLAGILESEELLPSLKAVNPKDARFGNGQYLSDIVPGTRTPAQLSRTFLGQPFQGARFTHFVEIDVEGLQVIKGRSGVLVVPNEGPLDLAGRIISSGVH